MINCIKCAWIKPARRAVTCWLSHTLCFLPCKHEHPTHSRGTTQKIKVIAICTIADFFCCCCFIFIFWRHRPDIQQFGRWWDLQERKCNGLQWCQLWLVVSGNKLLVQSVMLKPLGNLLHVWFRTTIRVIPHFFTVFPTYKYLLSLQESAGKDPVVLFSLFNQFAAGWDIQY